MYSLLVLPLTVLAVLHYLLVSRVRGAFTIDSIFVLSMWVMATGTFLILDDPVNATPGYALVSFAPPCVYMIASIVLFQCAPPHQRAAAAQEERADVTPVPVPQRPLLMGLFWLSFAITVLYYVSVGYNVFALGLEAVLSGSGPQEDYTSLRLNSYGSSRYLFPGYVNQFKNVILPTLSMVWVHYAFTTRQPFARLTAVALAVVSIFAVLGTGQRGAFVIFILTALLFVQRVQPQRFLRNAGRMLALAAPLMMVATLILGRSSSDLAASSTGAGRASVLLQEIAKRFFYDNQWSGTMAYRYIQSQPTQWGTEWLQGFLGILPSNPGSPLARNVFAYIYGNDRGTAPISMWGSVFYNFEWVGLLILPAILAMVYGRIASIQTAMVNPNALEVAGSAGVTAVAGNWMAGGPEQLLNAGAVAFAILWFIGRALPGSSARRTHNAPSPALGARTSRSAATVRKAPHGVEI